MEDITYKVYIKVENDIVTRIDSEWNIQDLTEWTYIDSGYGDKFHHAQSGYLPKGLFDEQGRFNYKYTDKLVELTEEEKEVLFPKVEPLPTLEEEVASLKEENELLTGCVMELTMLISDMMGE